MGEFSLTHILLVAMIFLIFFGPSRLPQLGQSLGKAIKGFKQGISEIDVDPKDIQDNTQISQNKNASMNSEKQTEKQTQSEKQNS